MKYSYIDFDDLEKTLIFFLNLRGHELSLNHGYTLAELIGEQWWYEYSGKQRRRIGLVFRKLVIQRRVPFVKIENLSNGWCIYQVEQPLLREVA